MGMFKHLLRSATKPRNVAIGETIGDYVSELLRALEQTIQNPLGVRAALMSFDNVMETFSETDDGMVYLGVQHWAATVATPSELGHIAGLFSKPGWTAEGFRLLTSEHATSGRGLIVFEQALKDLQIIQTETQMEIYRNRRT
jgi:hypothetical protein